MYLRIIIILSFFSAAFNSGAQPIYGRVFDAATNEPLPGVNVTSGNQNVFSDSAGSFILNDIKSVDSILISHTGYQPKKIILSGQHQLNISLTASFVSLNEVVVSGTRDLQQRHDVPVAIQTISKATINDTKATRLDMLVNKIPGAFMVDLGNEQHSMSIRQPLGYNSLYLYMEDGLPIRTVGDFNHNALIEINQASIERIEVIKGPASSLYGSEAVGGALNFITQSPTSFPTAKLQVEKGSRSYMRSDFSASNTFKKLGVYFGGYYAMQNQSADQHNDFHKLALTTRLDYLINSKTKLVSTVDYIRYKTDQKGGLDSLHFYNKDYSSFYRFTYREVNALRIKSNLIHDWNENNRTSAMIFFRRSAIGQNPFYYISDVPTDPSKATGQENEDAFNSYGAVVQHIKKFRTLQAKWITGASIDFSPASYYAKYIDVDRNTDGVYYQFHATDSLLTNYNVDLLNTAVYTQFEFNPVNKLKLVVAARYDRLDYSFDNHLPPGAYSGAPDAKDHFARLTPRAGLVYHLNINAGFYMNYSVGFAPPNITDLYTGVQIPVLKPSYYNNYEIGTWISFANNKAIADVSIYKLDGINEIVSTRLPDGTYEPQNAGRTSHNGIEAALRYSPVESLAIRVGGTYASHEYVEYIQEGKDYSGNEMSTAPAYIVNGEITYKPSFIKGLRCGLEYQGVGKYFTDPLNTQQYDGFNVFNVRMGYVLKGFEVWMNCINIGNVVYATTVEKSAYGTSYRPGQLRTFNVGIGYKFGNQY
jgi:iron complex outermembrane recepter protein